MTPMTNAEIAAIDARYAAGETVWMWCVHHEVLCEPLTEPLSNRIAYINTMKAAAERPRRLEELQPVLHPERLPVAWREAYRACQEAARACQEASHARQEAARARQEAARAWQEAYRARQEAYRAWQKAARARQEAYLVCQEADRALRGARRSALPELESLHREEYPDSAWDGKSIFGGAR